MIPMRLVSVKQETVDTSEDNINRMLVGIRNHGTGHFYLELRDIVTVLFNENQDLERRLTGAFEGIRLRDEEVNVTVKKLRLELETLKSQQKVTADGN